MPVKLCNYCLEDLDLNSSPSRNLWKKLNAMDFPSIVALTYLIYRIVLWYIFVLSLPSSVMYKFYLSQTCQTWSNIRVFALATHSVWNVFLLDTRDFLPHLQVLLKGHFLSLIIPNHPIKDWSFYFPPIPFFLFA